MADESDIVRELQKANRLAEERARTAERSSTPGRNTVGTNTRTTTDAAELKERKSLIQTLSDMTDATKSFTVQLGSGERATEYATDKFLDSLTKSTLGLSASMSGTSRMAASMHSELAKWSNNPRQFWAQISDFGAALDEVQDNLRTEGVQSFDEFSRNFTGGAGMILNSSSELYKTFSKLQKGGDRLQAGLSDAEQMLFIKLKTGAELNHEELKKLSKAFARVQKETTAEVQRLAQRAKAEISFNESKKYASDKVTRALNLSEMSIVGFTAAILRATMKLAEEYRMVAAAGLQHHFLDLSLNALGLGIATEKLTKIYRESSRMLLTLGVDNFNNSLMNGVDGLNRLGIFGESAANGASAFVKAAVDSGINPRSKKAIDESIRRQTNAFKNLRAVTGATIDEFTSLNEGLLSNATNQQLMLRLAPQERNARFNELVSLRQEFALRGLSAKAADAMVTAMQSFQKSKFKDRYEASARLQQLGGILGMSGAGQRAGQLALKRNRTGAEAAEFAGITANMKGAMEQFGNAGFAQENLMDVMDEGMGGAAKGLLEASVELKAAADGFKGVDEKVVAGAGEDSKVPPAARATIKAVEILQNALTAPLGIIALSTTGILALMLKGKFGDFTGMFKTAFGTLKRALMGPGFIGPLPPPPPPPSGFLAKLGAAFSSLLGSVRPLLGLIGGLAKRLPIIGSIIGAFTGIFDTFMNFSKYFKFDSLKSTLKSLGGIFVGAISGVISGFFIDLPSFIVDALKWVVKDVSWLSWLADGFDALGNMFEKIDEWWTDLSDSVIGSILGLSSKEKADVAAARATKKNADAIKDKTKAEKDSLAARTSEQYLGVTDKGSLSAGYLRSDVRSSINSDTVTATTKPDVRSSINSDTVTATTKPDVRSSINSDTVTATTKPDVRSSINSGNLDTVTATTKPDARSSINSGNLDNATATTKPDARSSINSDTVTATTKPDVRSSINSGNLDNATATTKPDSDKKTVINKKDDSSGSTTNTTTTTTSNSRQISLEDVVAKLQEILDATLIDTEQVVRVLSKLKGSNFTNNGNSSNVIR